MMRASPLIEYSSTVLILCLWIGAITSVFSSLIGLFQQDIKKVIAYSTMSQLGMMVIAVGLSSYNVALFHLINHAFALCRAHVKHWYVLETPKALSTRSAIKVSKNFKDFSKMGNQQEIYLVWTF